MTFEVRNADVVVRSGSTDRESVDVTFRSIIELSGDHVSISVSQICR